MRRTPRQNDSLHLGFRKIAQELNEKNYSVEAKPCMHCSQLFHKDKRLSVKRWMGVKFCSSKCFGAYRKTSGWTHNENARRKLSDSHKGVPCPYAGKYKRTAIHKKAISIGLIEMWQKRGDELRARIRKANTGRRVSEESRARMRLAAKRRPNYRGGPELKKTRKCWSQRRRVAKKHGNGGSHTQIQWEQLKMQYGLVCPSCLRKEPDIKLTEDHIIPLTKGGSDDIGNIQPLCKNCNSRKHVLTIKYPNLYAKNLSRTR